MADLSEYNRRRNFRRTPEPKGAAAKASASEARFVVQKHDARRLHYDFRLEIDGVLCSWAVPKGPSMDPGKKRLAVRTEDHPLDYGSFEGRIPAGEYGGGTVMLWDQGRFVPTGNPKESLRKGDLQFELHGRRLEGRFVLARMRRRGSGTHENWLLIKRRDDAARPDSGDSILHEHEISVSTGRGMADIAEAPEVWHAAGGRADAHRLDGNRQEKRRIAKVEAARLPGARKSRLPARMSPQLATLVEAAPEGNDWLSEIKFDGYRMLARIRDGEVQLFSRNGLPWEDKVPAIAQSLARLKVKQAWLDGELVALDEDGRSNFTKLKDELGKEKPRRPILYVFDILHLDGYNVTSCRQSDRKALLRYVIGAKPLAHIRYSDHMEGVPERIRQQACEMRLEGIMIKDVAAPYRQQRTRAWLKLKCIQREEFIVVGYTDPQGSREGFGALHLGYYDPEGQLHYAGGVGAGFNVKTLKALSGRLSRQVRKVPPAIWLHGEDPPKGLHWVKPDLVVETSYTEWTGGGAVRHAVFLGIRDDKAAAEVVRDPPTPAKARFAGAGAIVRAASSARKQTKTQGKSGGREARMPTVIDKRPPSSAETRLTHPDRVLWPAEGLTKQDLADYWARAAVHALPYIAARPLALVRCPDGIDAEVFFQKKLSPGFPRQVREVKRGREAIIAIDNEQGLRAMAQMSAVEIHPWGARLDSMDKPDMVTFDLDPGPGVDFDDVTDAAHEIRDMLKRAGLASFCKTTGGKGLHVVVPLSQAHGWAPVHDFAQAVAGYFAAWQPARFTATIAKSHRKGRIFIDYLRNSRGATAVAPFSPRARAGATIALPLDWRQVKAGLDPADHTIRAGDRQLAAAARTWKDFLRTEQEIDDKALRIFETRRGGRHGTAA